MNWVSIRAPFAGRRPAWHEGCQRDAFLRRSGEGVPVGCEEFVLIKVRPRGNESIQQMLKRFKRLCQREGLTRDMKRHSYYEKPSERKRRQSRKSIRRIEKDSND